MLVAHALLGSVWAAADSLDQVIQQTAQFLDHLRAAGLLTSVDGPGHTDGRLRSADSALHRAREAFTLLPTALRDARVATSGLDTTTPENGRWTLPTASGSMPSMVSPMPTDPAETGKRDSF
ncbi:hypothetical protein ABZ016_24615 [Streptomyces sp. NPDC006372]|uniref:hypothetical protein n=1 Tax=Streptomyces sp. NPDC006372 TaxID=3155599 RepID=UPI0033AF6B49